MTALPLGASTRYEVQAATYDRTRTASPTVGRLLAKFLGRGNGRTLLDVAGGTGNYAKVLRAAGFSVFVVDRVQAMVARSAPKVGAGRQVVADATALPVGDGAVECAVMISALHQMPDPGAVFAEARRVLDGGPYVIQAFTLENLAPLFVIDYFPEAAPDVEIHLPQADVERLLREAGFARVEAERFVYLDTADGTLAALHTDAQRLASPTYLQNTSFFHRLPEEARRDGLARLQEDLRSGRLAGKVRASFQAAVRDGHGTVFAAWA